MSTPATAMSVVAGVDGSDAGVLAVRWAAGAAGRHGIGLRLVHAVPDVPARLYVVDAQYIQALRRLAREDGQRFLDEAKAAASLATPGLDVTTVQTVGDPIETLSRASASARMVAVGVTGRSGLADLLAGSTALELPGRSHAPVVVVGHRPGGSLPVSGPVVVGVAGSPLDDPPVEFAFEQASTLGTDLIAVHSWSDSPLPDLDRITGKRNDWDAIFDRERRLVSEGLAGYGERYPDVSVRPVVVYDRPARALLAQAVAAQLLVVGTRGRGTLSGAILGSTSRAVLQLAPCPVAVVRQYS